MTAQGFMIPTNPTDWVHGGDRTNWCLAPNPWYANVNVFLQGSGLGATEARIGETVQIMVGVQGLASAATENVAVVQNIAAMVCYPTTGAVGTPGTLVASMSSSFPVWTAATQLAEIVPSAGNYQQTSGTTPSYSVIDVGAWIVGPNDTMGNPTAHACILAAASGLADATQDAGQTIGGTSVGHEISNISQLGSISVCTEPTQGQCNITILNVGVNPSPSPHIMFRFLVVAGRFEEPQEVTVETTEVAQRGELDPAVLSILKRGPYRDLEFRPAPERVKSVRLSRLPVRLEGPLAKVIREAHDIRDEALSDLTHAFSSANRLRLKLPPKAIQPIQMEVDVEPGQPPGSVHVFDITQTESNGQRGGIRIGVVVVPDK